MPLSWTRTLRCRSAFCWSDSNSRSPSAGCEMSPASDRSRPRESTKMSTDAAVSHTEKAIAQSPQMTERPWQPLFGLRADNADYPARGNLEGEGIVIFKTQVGYRG